jgi:heme a synthase
MYQQLIKIALVMAFSIIVLGAFVRLSDAGLGCPDWPGCYGHFTVPTEVHEIVAAEVRFPNQPVEIKKGWIEMVHRYFASLLGLLIIAIAVVAWRKQRDLGYSIGLPFGLVLLVIFQGLLGMWTVTLRLYPAVVTAHLVGGMSTLALLTWLLMRQYRGRITIGIMSASKLRRAALLALVVLGTQIVLGGWVSTNYAALACTDLPLCNGSWAPTADYANGFYPMRDLGRTASGQLLHQDALIAIHWVHRIGALITTLVIGYFAMAMLRFAQLKAYAMALLMALGLQIALGVANVWFSLPLPIAVAHNAGAAALLMILVAATFRIHNNQPY